jgi:hypothetical protein
MINAPTSWITFRVRWRCHSKPMVIANPADTCSAISVSVLEDSIDVTARDVVADLKDHEKHAEEQRSRVARCARGSRRRADAADSRRVQTPLWVLHTRRGSN